MSINPQLTQDPPQKNLQRSPRRYTFLDPATNESVTFDWHESRDPEEDDIQAVFDEQYQEKQQQKKVAPAGNVGGQLSSTGILPGQTSFTTESEQVKRQRLADEARARILVTETERIKADPKIQAVVSAAEKLGKSVAEDEPLSQYAKEVESFHKEFPDYVKQTESFASKIETFDKQHPTMKDELAFLDRLGERITDERQTIDQAAPEAKTQFNQSVDLYNRTREKISPVMDERNRLIQERRQVVPKEADERAQKIAEMASSPELATGLGKSKAAQEFYVANKEPIDYYRRVQEGISSIPGDTFAKVALEGDRGERLMRQAEQEFDKNIVETKKLRSEIENGIMEGVPFSDLMATAPRRESFLRLPAILAMKPEERALGVLKMDVINKVKREEQLMELAKRQLTLATIVPRTRAEAEGTSVVSAYQRSGLTSGIVQAGKSVEARISAPVARVKADLETYIPFIGSMIEAGYNSKLQMAQEKAKADPSLNSLTPGEQALLKAADLRSAYEGSRPIDWATQGVLATAASVPWFAEIGLTGPLNSSVRNMIIGNIENPSLVRRIMAATMAVAVQAEVNVGRQQLQFTELKLDGLNNADALWASHLMNVASYVSELYGHPISNVGFAGAKAIGAFWKGKGVGEVGKTVLKNSLAVWTGKQVSKEVAEGGIGAFIRTAARFHGAWSEIEEEEFEYILDQTILGREIKMPFATSEGTDRLIDEAIAISFMSVGFKAIEYGVPGIARLVGPYNAKKVEQRNAAIFQDLEARFPAEDISKVRGVEELGIKPAEGVQGFVSEEELAKRQEQTAEAEKARQRTLQGAPESKVRPVESVPQVPETEQALREDLVAAGVAEADVVRMTEPELRNRWKQEAGMTVTENEKAQAILSKPENLIDPYTGQEVSKEDALRRELKVTRGEARSILQSIGELKEIPKKTSTMSLEDFGEEKVKAARAIQKQYRKPTISRLSNELGISPQEARRLRELITTPEAVAEPAPKEKAILPVTVKNNLIRNLGVGAELLSEQELINRAEQQGLSATGTKENATTDAVTQGRLLTEDEAKNTWKRYEDSLEEASKDVKKAVKRGLIKEAIEGYIMKVRGWTEHRTLTDDQIRGFFEGKLKAPTSLRDVFGLRDKINERGRYTGRADDIREAQKAAEALGLQLKMDSATNMAKVFNPETGKNVKAPGPEITYGDKVENPKLLEDMPAGTVQQIQTILYNLGSSIDIQGMNRAQVAAAIKDIQTDKGEEATLGAQILIDRLLDDIKDGAVGVKVPGGKSDVLIDQMEAPPVETPAGTEVVEPLNVEDIPEQLRVEIDVVSEELGTRARISQNARQALNDVNTNIEQMRKLLDCVTL